MLNVLLYLNYSFFALKKQNFLCSRGWSQVYDAPASAFLSAQIIGFDTTPILTLSYLTALKALSFNLLCNKSQVAFANLYLQRKRNKSYGLERWLRG